MLHHAPPKNDRLKRMEKEKQDEVLQKLKHAGRMLTRSTARDAEKLGLGTLVKREDQDIDQVMVSMKNNKTYAKRKRPRDKIANAFTDEEQLELGPAEIPIRKTVQRKVGTSVWQRRSTVLAEHFLAYIFKEESEEMKEDHS